MNDEVQLILHSQFIFSEIYVDFLMLIEKRCVCETQMPPMEKSPMKAKIFKSYINFDPPTLTGHVISMNVSNS